MLGAGPQLGEVELGVPSLSLFSEGVGPRGQLHPFILLQEAQEESCWGGWVEGERRTRRGWHKGVMGGGGQLRRQKRKFCQLPGKTGSRRLRHGEGQRASPCELFHLS